MAEERAEPSRKHKRSIKRQVIGAVVLLGAMAVVFPILFDGSGRIPVKKVTDIPPVIKSKPFELAEPEAAPIEWATPEPLVAANQAVQEPATLKQEQISTADTGQPEPTALKSIAKVVAQAPEKKLGWAVQLGTFGNLENAKRLVQGLKTEGYDSWMQTKIGSDNISRYQVFAGPWVEEKQARAVNDKLNKRFNVNGLVIRRQGN